MTPKQWLFGVIAYLLVVSVAAVWMTVSDKLRAQKNRRRISESSLLLVAFFGGALAEYCTMRCIRHKTLHKKFMIGLPFILILHLCAAALFIYLFKFRP